MCRYRSLLLVALLGLLCSHVSAKARSLTIVGGGIIGAFEAYTAYQEALQNGDSLRVTIFEKNADITQTTSTNIVPSLTPDEIVSVVPRGQELVEKLAIPFYLPGGIEVHDVPGVAGADTNRFVEAALRYGANEEDEHRRKEVLLALGKRSMALWERLYDQGDAQLRQILDASNFHGCHEPRHSASKLQDGYRIDPIYKVADAHAVALDMQKAYRKLGYQRARTLLPEEVIEIDPYLSDFVNAHTRVDRAGVRRWHQDASAVYRPGGCLSTELFLPQLYHYLAEKMGTHVDNNGNEHANFQLKFGHRVTGAILQHSSVGSTSRAHIIGLEIDDGSRHAKEYLASDSEYVFSPGEAVGTITRLGFREPPFAGFAGAALRLTIPMSQAQRHKFSRLNHCMEVRQEGVVLAWQVRLIDEGVSIGVGGTKAFYGGASPNKDQAFAKNRNVLQLNMINDVLPQLVSIALARPTQGQNLTEDDLQLLEQRQLVRRWVGTRAVAFDGFPTLGALYTSDGFETDNGRVTTGLGSGGVSFAPAAVQVSRCVLHPGTCDDLTHQVLEFSRSDR